MAIHWHLPWCHETATQKQARTWRSGAQACSSSTLEALKLCQCQCQCQLPCRPRRLEYPGIALEEKRVEACNFESYCRANPQWLQGQVSHQSPPSTRFQPPRVKSNMCQGPPPLPTEPTCSGLHGTSRTKCVYEDCGPCSSHQGGFVERLVGWASPASYTEGEGKGDRNEGGARRGA